MIKAILLSGGIDSIALCYWKKPDLAITLDYGQVPAEAEIQASESVCSLLGIIHHTIKIDCSGLGSGDLINSQSIAIAPSTEWWPYRNQMLITLAAMKAASLGVGEILIGSVLTDGFHKDGTSRFYELINSLMQFQEGGIKVSAPCISLSSKELVLKSGVPPGILLFAHSCHKSNLPCGRCRGCNKYIQVFKDLQDAKWEES